MSRCIKCKLSHDLRMQCQFVESKQATPAPAAEVNITEVINALGRMVTLVVDAQNSTMATRVNLLGADYVRKQEQAAVEAVTAAVAAVGAAAAPYITRLCQAEIAVVEAKARNEVKILDGQASRLDAEARAAAAAARPAHRRHRR
jgi:hypothetical protein